MKAHEMAPLLKKFLYEKIGYSNIGNGIVSVVDDYTLAFKIREMSFMLDCDTITLMRLTDTIDGKTAVTYSHVDSIAGILERSIKEYVCTIIEKIENMQKAKQKTFGNDD